MTTSREDYEVVFGDYAFPEALLNKIKDSGFTIHEEYFYKDTKFFVGINKGDLGKFIETIFPYLAGSSLTILHGQYVILIGAETKQHDFVYAKE